MTGKLREKNNRGKREFPRDKAGLADIVSGLLRPYGLAVRTPPFHGGSPGSIPGRVATSKAQLSLVKSSESGALPLWAKS